MYLKDNYQGYNFQKGYKQVFIHKCDVDIEDDIINTMVNNKLITSVELNIAKFLLKFGFATKEMLVKYIGKGLTIEKATEILDKLVRIRILNKFMLSIDDNIAEIPSDALFIYCLDVGGKTLLKNYSNEDTSSWNTVKNMKSSEVIAKDIATTNFYIKLIENCPNKVKYFKLNPEYSKGKKTAIVASFEMALEDNNGLSYYIGEVVRDGDFPTLFKEKLRLLEGILTTNSWKKYFYGLNNPPPIFIYCENDKNAMDVAKMVTGLTEISAVRYTTDKRLDKGIDKIGAFLKYDRDKEALQTVRLSTFD